MSIDTMGRPARSSERSSATMLSASLNQRDRGGIGGLRDPRGIVALCSPGGDANELPGRCQTVHHQDQGVEEKIRLAHTAPVKRRLRHCRIDLLGHRIDFVAIENADVVRQAPGKIAEHIAQRQQGNHRAEIFLRARRADLNGEPPSRSFVGTGAEDGVFHAQDGAVLQRPSQLLRFGPVVGHQGAVDILAERFGFGCHEIATDPGPDRFKRDPRDAADPLVFGASVDQKRLERGEEQSRRIADPRHRPGVGADGAAQFLKHYFVAGAHSAAQ
ncbi:MAG: hypothetical protein WBF27_20340 [Xanthobacteraceae bacterium]